ncbi:probable E3 ubiquitin-protein ligase ATL45 [Triticum dicoccoides]|uniref:probable E3 ubiquitin-protein ligase ATL45 n=1 Tax=Triticum dicoccoides TaxID=85692 RepID=UPI0018909466|nr:probable E3 ubiquitin-protein ligase ATL45 [Triticum dicoccoides]
MVDPFLVFALICVFGPFLCALLCACPCASALTTAPAPAPVAGAKDPGSQHRSPAAQVPEPVAVEKPRLRYFLYSATAATTEGDGGVRGASVVVCSICLEALVDGAECSEVPACRHVFHWGCLALWITKKNTCPLCRRPVMPGSEPLSAAEEMV